MNEPVSDFPAIVGWIQALGPTITIAGAFLIFIMTQRRNRLNREEEIDRERKNIASAILGEISSIVRIISFRNYEVFIRALLEQARNANDGDPINLPVIHMRQNYFQVFESLTPKLGLLPAPLPERIATFYTALKSLVDDATTIAEGLHTGDPAEQKLRLLFEMDSLLTSGLSIGRQLILALSKVAGTDPPVGIFDDPDAGETEGEPDGQGTGNPGE